MQEQKQHSACDQCRRRKLKCPGEKPACSRCQDEQISCNYSPRKVMGRPRKRRREDEEPSESAEANNRLDLEQPSEDVIAEDIPIPDFDDWVLPAAAVAGGHDEEMQYMMQQNDNGILGSDSSVLPQELLNSEWNLGQSYLPSPYSQDDGGPTINGDVVEDSISIGQYYAARFDGNGTGDSSDEPCTCLSSMYLAASSLERSRHAGFPVALTPLRAAMQTTKIILLCRKCPTERAAGCQNVMILNALLNSIAMGFDKLLRSIISEVERAKEASETKAMDVGDRSITNAHFHTGTDDCPARFSIELEPEEWGVITKRVVKKCVWGNVKGVLTLERLVDATEARQKAWHSVKLPSTAHVEHSRHHGDWNCLRLTAEVRRIMTQMPE